MLTTKTLRTGSLYAASRTYTYARGQAWVRPCGEHVDGEWDGEAGQTGMNQCISGQ